MFSEARSIKIWLLKLAQKFKAVCWPNKAHLWPLGCPVCFHLDGFCVSTLAPSLFETLKLSSSDEYHLLQCPEHPHICTHFVCSILLSPLISRFYCVVRATSNACPAGRKPSLDRQTTSVIVTLQSTLSSRPTVHATYRLTLSVNLGTFLTMSELFFIRLYRSSKAVTVPWIKQVLRKMMLEGNHVCLHRISWVSRSGSSGVSGIPQAKRQDSHQPS